MRRCVRARAVTKSAFALRKFKFVRGAAAHTASNKQNTKPCRRGWWRTHARQTDLRHQHRQVIMLMGWGCHTRSRRVPGLASTTSQRRTARATRRSSSCLRLMRERVRGGKGVVRVVKLARIWCQRAPRATKD